jgi:hypothetical protein
MNASANCALFLQSSASNTLLPELTNRASAEIDDYTHMPHQEDEWGLGGVRAVESLKLRTAQSDERQKVLTMKLAYHHRRLLQHLLDHSDFAHGLHTLQVKRKAESLIKMGYIDESWRVTEAGKSRLANEDGQQQQEQTLSEGSLNQASEAIGRDIPNTAAHAAQAELLRAEQLSLQHNAQLALYAQAKAQQIDTLQAALQTALHNQVAKLAAIEHHAPAWPANRQARSTWQNQLAQAKTRLAELERRSERVGEIATGAGLYADSPLDELAARKLRFRDPDLARRWDALQQQQRKAALQKIHSTQIVELALGRTRALSFSSES